MLSSNSSEIAAIFTGAGIFPLTDRAFLRVTGLDATRWLNGMVTNSIQSLAPGEGNYNFLLNAQGRIQGDCTIYREPDRDQPVYLLITEREQMETIHQLLDKFIIMDDVELTEADYYRKPLLIIGLKAPDILRKIEIPTLEYAGTHSDLKPLQMGFYPLTANPVYTPSPGLVTRFEVASESRDILMEEAIEAGAVVISAETIEAFRILEGRPRYGQDIRNSETARDLPQETNQTHALHFSKGCYLGQEIVERIRSRGQVHRTFTGFRLTALPATLPAPLTAEGKPAGEITSAAVVPLPGGEAVLALGYVRREALLQFEARNQPLDFDGGTATPVSLPFTPS